MADRDVAAVVRVQVQYDDTVKELYATVDKYFAQLEKKYKDSPFAGTIQNMQLDIKNLRSELSSTIQETVKASELKGFETRINKELASIQEVIETGARGIGEEIPKELTAGIEEAKTRLNDMMDYFEKYVSASKSLRQFGNLEFRAVNTEEIHYAAEEIKEFYDILNAFRTNPGIREEIINEKIIQNATNLAIAYKKTNSEFVKYIKNARAATNKGSQDDYLLHAKELYNVMSLISELAPNTVLSEFNGKTHTIAQDFELIQKNVTKLEGSLGKGSKTLEVEMGRAQASIQALVEGGTAVKDTRAEVQAFNLSDDGTIKIFAKIADSTQQDLINQLTPILEAVQAFATDKLIKINVKYEDKEKVETAVAKPETVEEEVIKKVASRVQSIPVKVAITKETLEKLKLDINSVNTDEITKRVNALFATGQIDVWKKSFSDNINSLSAEIEKFRAKMESLGQIKVKPIFEADEGQKASINALFNDSTVTVLTSMNSILDKIAKAGSDIGKTQLGETLSSLSGFLTSAQGESAKGATDFLNSFGVLKDTNPAKAFIDSLNKLSGSAGLADSIKLINTLSNVFSYAGNGGESNRMTELVNSINEFNGNESINTFFDKFKAANDSLTTSGFTTAVTELRGLFAVSHGDTINADSLNTFIAAAKDFKGDTGLGDVIGKIETAANSIADGSPIKTVFDAISNFATTVNGVDIGGTGITDFVKALLDGTLADGVSEAFTSVSGVVNAIGENTGLQGVLSTLLQFDGRDDGDGNKSRMESLKDSLNGIVPSAGAESFIDSLTRLLTTASSNDPQAALTALLNFASGTQGTGNGRTRAVNFQAVRDFLEALWLVFAEFNGNDTHIDESRTETLRNFLHVFTEFSGEIGGAATRMSSFVNAITNLSHAMLTVTDESLTRFGKLVRRLNELQIIAYRNTGNIGLTSFVNALQQLGIASNEINPSDNFSTFLTNLQPILSINATNATAENLNAIIRTVQAMQEVNDALRGLTARPTQNETGENVFARFEHFIGDLERINTSFSGIKRNTNLESITSFVTGIAGPAQNFTNAENFERFVTAITQLTPAFSGITINDAAITSLSNGLSRIIEFANGATRYAAFVSIMGALERILPHVANMNGGSNFSAFAVGIGQIVRVAQDLRDADGFNRFTTFIQTLVGTANTVLNVDSFNIMVRTVISLFAVARQLNDKVSENLYKGAVALEEYALASNGLHSTDEFLKLVAALRLLIEAAQWITNVDEFVTLGVGINQIAEASQKITNPDVISMLLKSLEGLILLTGLTAEPKNLNNLVYVFEGFTRAAKDVDPNKVVALVKALGDLVYASEFMTDDGTSLGNILSGIQTLAGAGEQLKGLRNVGNILNPIKDLITSSYDLGNTDKLNQFVQTIGELIQISRNTQNTQVFVNLLTVIKDFKFDQSQSSGLEQFSTGFTKIANILIQKNYDPRKLLELANAINQFNPKSDLGEKLTRVGEGLGIIVSNVKDIPETFKDFSSQLVQILQYGEALKQLSYIMQKPMKQLKQVQQTLSNTTDMRVNVPSMEKQISAFERAIGQTDSYSEAVKRLRTDWEKFKFQYNAGNNVNNEDLVMAENLLKSIKGQINEIYSSRNKYRSLIDLGFDEDKLTGDLSVLKASKDQTATYRNELTKLEDKIREVSSAYHGMASFTDEDKKSIASSVAEIEALFKKFKNGEFSGTQITDLKILNPADIDKSVEELGKLEGQTGQFTDKLAELKDKYGQYQSLIKNGFVDKNDISKVKELSKEMATLMKWLGENKAYVASSKGMRTNIKDAEDLRQRIIALGVDAKNIDIDKSKANRIIATFKNVDGSVEKLTYSLKDANEGLVLIQRTVSGDSLVRFRDMLESIGKNFMYYFSGRMLFYKAISGIKSGVEVIKELNTQFTEMRKVSDESLTTLKKYVDTSFDIAKAVGSTSTAVLSSTADYMRLGKSLNEASELAKNTAILLNVSEFDDVSAATDSLISMTQAYQELTSKEIIDRLNYAGNNFSISTSDLAQSLQKSAGTLKVAGNEFNEAIALTVAGNAILQDPSKVAAGLRTISLRITGTKAAKEELEELGEDVDDFVLTTSSKLNETVKGLTKVGDSEGISLLTDAGNYRSTYDILQDIADIWDDIKAEDKLTGENRQNALLELLAGKNRSNVLAAILDDAQLLRRVFEEVSANSEGSALKELDKYMDSIDGKLKQLATQAQEFWNTIIDPEIVKGVITILSQLLELVNSILKATPGAILPYLGGIVSIFMASHGVSLAGVVGDFLKLGKAAKVASDAIDPIQEQLVQMGESGIDSLGRKMSDVSASAATLGSTIKVVLKNLATIGVITAVIGGIAFVVDQVSNGVERLNAELRDVTSELDNVKAEYEDLNDKSKTDKLTIAERIRLDFLKQQTEELEKQKELTETNIALKKLENTLFSQFDSNTYASKFNRLSTPIGNAVDFIEADRAHAPTANQGAVFTGYKQDLENREAELQNSWVEIVDTIDQMNGEIAVIENAVKKNIGGATQKDLKDAKERLNNFVQLANDYLTYYTELARVRGTNVTLEDRFRQVGSVISLVARNTETGLISITKLGEYFPELAKAANEAHWSINYYSEVLGWSSSESEEAANSTVKLSDTFSALRNEIAKDAEKVEELNTAFDKTISTINSLKDAQEKLKAGELTKEDVLALLKDSPKLASEIDWQDLNFGNLDEAIATEINRIRDEEVKALQDRQEELAKLLHPEEVPEDIRKIYEEYKTASDTIAANGYKETLSIPGIWSESDVSKAEGTIVVDGVEFAINPVIRWGSMLSGMEFGSEALINYLREAINANSEDGVIDFDALIKWDEKEASNGVIKYNHAILGARDATTETANAFEASTTRLAAYNKLLEYCNGDTDALAVLTELLGTDMSSLSTEYEINAAKLAYLNLLLTGHTKTVSDLHKEYDTAMGKINTLDGAIEKLLSKQMKDSDVIDLMLEFKELAAFDDIDLNDKVNFGNLLQRLMELRNNLPTPLIEEMQQLRKEIEATASPETLNELDTLIAGLQRAVTFDVTGADAFTQAISDAFGRTNSTVQSTLSYYEDLAKLQEAIADGFVMDAEKAWELAQMFPELSKGIMEYGVAGDGLVELNQEIVEGLLEGGDTAIDATIKQLESEKALLQGKRDAAQAELDLAENVLTAKDRAQRNQALTELERYQEVANKKIEAEQTIDEEVAKSDQDQIDNHGFVAQMVGKVASFISENMGQAAQDASSSVSDSSDKMQLSLGNIVDAAKGAWAAIKSIGSDTFSGFKNFVGGAGGSKIFDRVKGWFGGLGNAFGEGVETLKTKISEFRQVFLDNSRIEGLVADLKIELSNYDDAIAAIDGQITTLKNLQGNVAERIKRSGDDDGSGGSGGSDGSDAAAEQFSETIDWIERAIEMVEKAIDRLSKTAGNVYAIFSKRNRALLDQIEKVKEEIYLQQEAYATYMAIAESVDLAEEYKAKVREGLLQVEIIENEELSEKISLYKEWFDKAEAAKDAMQDLQITLGDLAKQKFDDIAKNFEDNMSLLEHRANMVNGTINQASERGFIAAVKYYEALTDIENDNLTALNEEREALLGALADAVRSGAVEEGSEAWFEMQNQVHGVTEAIQESETALISYANSIRDIQWEIFDRVEDSISQITEETEFLIGLLNDDKNFDGGEITKQGQAAYGLHAVNYQVYMEQAADYAREITKINQDLAVDPYDTVLIDRRKELLGLQRDMIEAAEDEKDAMKDLTEEGVQSFLDAMKDAIDTYKDMMSEWNDDRTFQKNIEEQTTAIATLQKQLDAYAGDDSEAGMLNRQQTQKSLLEAREKLEESQRDYYMSETEKMLDNLYDEAESALNARLDDFESLLTQIFDGINANSESIAQTLKDVTADVYTELSESMNQIWTGSASLDIQGQTTAITDVLSTYGEKIGTVPNNVSSTIDAIAVGVKVLSDAAEAEAKAKLHEQNEELDKTTVTKDNAAQLSSSGSGSSGSASGNGSGVSTGWQNAPETNTKNTQKPGGDFWIYKKDSYPKNKLNVDTSVVDRLKFFDIDSSFASRCLYYEALGLGSASSYLGTAEQNQKLLRAMRARGYKKGLLKSSMKHFAMTQEDGLEIINKPGLGMLTPIGRGDTVFNAEQTKALWEISKNYIDQFSKIPSRTGVNVGQITNNNTLNISVDRIMDYDDFTAKMKADGNFEKFIKACSTDQLNGKLSVSKRRINF